MKPIILKKVMPFAVFALGILGAFATTSMQSAAKADLVIGYPDTPQNPCSVPINCSDEGNEACRVSYDDGEQVFGKDQESETTCSEILKRPL